jgi:hypothetical protein
MRNDKPKTKNKMKNLNNLKTFEGCTFEEWKEVYISDMNDEMETLQDTEWDDDEDQSNNFGEDVEYFENLISDIELTTEWVELFELLGEYGRGWSEEGVLEEIEAGNFEAEWK